MVNRVEARSSLTVNDCNAELGRSSPSIAPRQRCVRYGLLFVLFFALLYMRRSPQLLHPQVWDEDGTRIIPGFLDHGLASLAFPVGGYLVLVPKLISGISLAISGVYYPVVSTIVTWLVILAICIGISESPLWIKGGPLLAICVFLIPSDPEVFGIPLYTFWWASLLLYLVVLWDENSADTKSRIVYTLLGGLSSPIIYLVTPFLMIRAVLFRRNRREFAILATALLCCLLQALTTVHFVNYTITHAEPTRRSLHDALPKFIGEFLVGNYRHATISLVWFAAGLFLMFVLFAIPFLRSRPRYFFLVGLWIGTVCLVAKRIDLSLLHPRLAGPRYFFLPFVLLSWFLVGVLVESRRNDLKLCAAAFLLFSALNMFPVRSHTQQDFHWAQHVSQCAQSDRYTIPISYDGQTTWSLEVNHAECMTLQRAGFIH